MADTPLRALLAQFTVELDPDGALERGNAQVDALKKKLVGLERELARVRAPAAAAGQALARAFAPAAARLGSAGRALGMGGGGGPPLLGGGSVPLLGAGGGGGGVLARAGGGPLAGLLGAGGGGEIDTSAFTRLGANARGGPLAALQGGVGRLAASAKSAFSGLATGLSSIAGPATIAAASIGVLVHQTIALVDSIGGIGEAAAKLGVTNAEFQRLDVLAQQNATSVESLGAAFRTLAGNAVDPSKDAADAFRQLGVSTKAADGSFKSRNELFFETAGALADIQDSTLRADLAQRLYGRGAAELGALLGSGRAGLEAQRAELEKLPVLSDEVIAKADAFGDSWIYAKAQLTALAGPALNDLAIPALQSLVDLVKAAAPTIATFGRHFVTIFKTFGVGAKVASNLATSISGLFRAFGIGAPSLEKTVDLLGKIGIVMTDLINLPMLLIEDFQVFLKGGDSVIGRAAKALGALFTKAADIAKQAFADFFQWIGAKLSEIPGKLAQIFTPDILRGLNFAAGPEGLLGTPSVSIPVPGSASAGGTTNITSADGDRNVTVNLPPGASARDVAPAVSAALERDREATIAGVAGGW